MLPARLPREPDTRSKIQIAVDVFLVLVPQTKTQSEIRSQLPVVLNVAAKIPLTHLRLRVAGRQEKLRCATAKQPDLIAAQSLLEENHCPAITLDTCKFSKWTNAAAKKPVSAAEVLWRKLRDIHRTNASTGFQRMITKRERSVVGEFPIIRVSMRLANLRSASGESVLNFYRRNRVVGVLRRSLALKLKARFVNNLLVDDRGFG